GGLPLETVAVPQEENGAGLNPVGCAIARSAPRTWAATAATRNRTLRPWLFRIAHSCAVDHLRRESLRRADPLESALGIAEPAEHEPDAVLARQQAVRAAVGSFLALAPAQRAYVILWPRPQWLPSISMFSDVGLSRSR